MTDNKLTCAKCGNPLDPDDAFCGECGYPVSSTHTGTPQSKPIEKTQQASAPHHMPPPHPISPPQVASEKPERKFKKLWLATSIIAGLLILVVTAFFIYDPLNSVISQQTSGQDKWAINQIKIMNVDSYYEHNASLEKIFVVNGNVINQSMSPLRFILLEATLYGPEDVFLTRQSAYAGNVIDRQQLKYKSMHSIKLMMHRPYGHNQGENLAGGGTLPFMIVFGNLPGLEQVRYELRVIDASVD